MGRYLDKDLLRGFDSYKYSSLDTSPFSNYVMHPFWNWFLKLVPKNIAANTLTFVGFLLLPVSFIILSYYDYDFSKNSNIPRWVWLMCAFNNFMSHTLDGIDGKQARRTNTSSVLGELFDHGLDAWSTSFFAMAIFDIFGRGEWGASSIHLLMVLNAIQCTFIFSHWEKYNTGVLYLPWAYDLALVGMTLAYALTYLFGVEVWQYDIYYEGQRYTVGFLLECLLYISNYAMSVPVCIFNVLLSYKNGTGKMLPFTESIRPLIPIVLFFPLITLWGAYSQTGILESHPRCFFLLSSVLFASITTRMIVNQMSGTRAQAFNWLLIPLIIFTPICTLYNVDVYEVYILYTYTGFATLAHIDYGQCTVKEIADYLNINVFSIAKRPAKDKRI
ncbi:ethanolaminephosphotransferase 1-like [Watersipora subatra]|uniref:ethanolaminephosphotransferase 1-like n=1 Tax=Watersipora subatra TaxID=2589382 RepID=UPI00355B9921